MYDKDFLIINSIHFECVDYKTGWLSTPKPPPKLHLYFKLCLLSTIVGINNKS